MRTPLRRLLRVPARLAAAAALLALPVAHAEAQPRCRDGSLADYLGLGAGGCRLGRMTFANFTLENEILAATNATILTPDLASGVFPYRRGAIGVAGFGFQFEELFNAVGVHTDVPDVLGHVRSTFRFTFESTLREIRRARLIGAVFVDEAQSPDDLAGRARFSAEMGGGGSTCLDFTRRRTEAGHVFDVADPCSPDAVAVGTVTYVFESRLARTGGTGTVEGMAGAGVIIAGFRAQPIVSAVPEPSTVALLAGGLLALAGAVHPRRRRA